MCNCGNSYGKYGYTSEKDCNLPCSNQYQMCGGNFSNSVYQINCMNLNYSEQSFSNRIFEKISVLFRQIKRTTSPLTTDRNIINLVIIFPTYSSILNLAKF